jgi:phosphatidate phosphatase APP1
MSTKPIDSQSDLPQGANESNTATTAPDSNPLSEAPVKRWSLVQEYARTPGRKFLRASAQIRREARQWLGTPGEPTVVPYIGYGSVHGSARVFARVLETSAAPPPSVSDSVWTNFKRSYQQWKTSELPGKRVRITCAGRSVVVESDAEGYVDALFDTPALSGPWEAIDFRLHEPTLGSSGVPGELFVPSADAAVGIISDIDDTILQTNVQDLMRMVTLSVFGNALTRMGYPGTTEWFQGLVRHTNGPTFYISRSAWNLFPLLRGFVEYQGLPLGPMLLRDVGLHRGKERKRGHKFRRMSEVLDMYPNMRFICVGDSGQRDAEIYASLAETYPGRVVAIYIRDVGDADRRHVAEAACEKSGLPSLVFADTQQAIEHSRQLGLWAG